MKCCSKCKIEKEDSEFREDRNQCNECRKKILKEYYKNNIHDIKKYVKEYRKNKFEKIKKRKKNYYLKNCEEIKKASQKRRCDNPKKELLRHAKKRAKKYNLPFNITENDFEIPDVCPVLEIPIKPGIGKHHIQPDSPTLDRVIPELGYVKGNIIIISNKANIIKSNATPKEIITVGEFYKKLLEEAKKNE